jgi:hypothetical protein
MKPTLKAPESKCLKLEHERTLSNSGFKFNLRRFNQGKKINLSLTEMAQFFMKMAEASKKGKLKPGATLPGCNSYFLCKYLKDTMVNAKTYLFCAIRPEVTFHPYTYATLGFANNASVIKLQPKKATSAAGAYTQLIHFSAQPKPFWSHLPVSPYLILGGKSCTQRIPQNVLMLSRKVDECKPLVRGVADGAQAAAGAGRNEGRGLHSFTLELNLSNSRTRS